MLADVERGLWHPRPADVRGGPDVATFHEFASEWFEAPAAEASWRENTSSTTMAARPITCCRSSPATARATSDRRGRPLPPAKVARASCRATSINKTITRLGQILDVAVEYELSAATRRGQAHVGSSREAAAAWLDAPSRSRRCSTRPASSTPRRGSTGARPAARDPGDARLRRPADRRSPRAALARRRPGGRPAAGRRLEDGRRHPRGRSAPSSATSCGAQGRVPRSPSPTTSSSRPRRAPRPRQRPQPGPHPRSSARTSSCRGGAAAAPGGPDAHTLRHTYASLLFAIGEDART